MPKVQTTNYGWWAGVGALLGLPASVALWIVCSAFYRFGKSEAYTSQGMAWAALIILFLVGAALVALFVPPSRDRLHPKLRMFLLGLFFVLLGGMSLCNAFTASLLFPKG